MVPLVFAAPFVPLVRDTPLNVGFSCVTTAVGDWGFRAIVNFLGIWTAGEDSGKVLYRQHDLIKGAP